MIIALKVKIITSNFKSLGQRKLNDSHHNKSKK